MSYSTCQTALKTVLLTLSTRFSAGDVLENSNRNFDNGRAVFAELWPGAVVKLETVSYVTEQQWQILLDLYVRMIDDTSNALFQTIRDEVLAKILDYPTLNTGQCLVNGISSEGEPEPVRDKNGQGPFFIYQGFKVGVTEKVSRTAGEYAT
jgi:hypothetical protein